MGWEKETVSSELYEQWSSTVRKKKKEVLNWQLKRMITVNYTVHCYKKSRYISHSFRFIFADIFKKVSAKQKIFD